MKAIVRCTGQINFLIDKEVQHAKKEICKQVIRRIRAYLHDPDCLSLHREEKRFVRKRSLSMLQVIQFIFYSSKASMCQNLASIITDLPDIGFPNVSKQAISRARQGIKPSLFSELFNLSVDVFYNNVDDRKRWNNYHIFAIDGSKLELPNSESNFKIFGELFTTTSKEPRYFTQALGSMVYDVMDDYIVHASIHPYLSSERAAALSHLQTLESLDIYEDSIVIFDRGYYSEALFRYCVEHEHLCVMRLKQSINIAKNCHGDSHFILKGNPVDGTDDIEVRVIEVTLDDGSKEYLATNLDDEAIKPSMFKELYFLRWPIECKYYELKERLDIESFNGATSTSVVQEFYLNMLLANITSLLKNHVDSMIDESSNPNNKYRYQANRSFITGRLKKILPILLFIPNKIQLIDNLVDFAFKCRSQIQPGRSSERRKQNGVRRTHFRNRKTVC